MDPQQNTRPRPPARRIEPTGYENSDAGSRRTRPSRLSFFGARGAGQSPLSAVLLRLRDCSAIEKNTA